MNARAISCHDVVRDLWDFLDSELDATRWTAIREHLATCEGCRSHVEFCRAFLARVGELPVSAEELERTAARVRASLREEAAR
jgi:anti-sigma factor RsiW